MTDIIIAKLAISSQVHKMSFHLDMIISPVKTFTMDFYCRFRDMQRESRAEIHHNLALMRKVVRSWKSRRLAATGDCEEEEEEGISSESIGKNERSDCHYCTVQLRENLVIDIF